MIIQLTSKDIAPVEQMPNPFKRATFYNLAKELASVKEVIICLWDAIIEKLFPKKEEPYLPWNQTVRPDGTVEFIADRIILLTPEFVASGGYLSDRQKQLIENNRWRDLSNFSKLVDVLWPR